MFNVRVTTFIVDANACSMVQMLLWQTLNLEPVMMTTRALAEPLQNIMLRTSLLTLRSCKITSAHLVQSHDFVCSVIILPKSV